MLNKPVVSRFALFASCGTLVGAFACSSGSGGGFPTGDGGASNSSSNSSSGYSGSSGSNTTASSSGYSSSGTQCDVEQHLDLDVATSTASSSGTSATTSSSGSSSAAASSSGTGTSCYSGSDTGAITASTMGMMGMGGYFTGTTPGMGGYAFAYNDGPTSPTPGSCTGSAATTTCLDPNALCVSGSLGVASTATPYNCYGGGMGINVGQAMAGTATNTPPGSGKDGHLLHRDRFAARRDASPGHFGGVAE